MSDASVSICKAGLKLPARLLGERKLACLCRATKEEVKQVAEKAKPSHQDPTKTPEP